jgi:hypothetical protein
MALGPTGNRPMRASCLCGGIQISLSALPTKYYQCHCSLCRKQSGGASNAATIVKTNSIIWESGQDLLGKHERKTGFRSYFCTGCGSPVPNPIGDGSLSWLPLGILDEPAQLELVANIFIGSKAPWAALPTTGVCHNEMPPISEFLKVLHG